jgi:Ca-activated chloride channel family protein
MEEVVMKLRTLMLLSATGMIATGAIVWTAVGPAHGSPQVADDPPSKPPAPPPPADHSRFQAGKTLMVEGRLGNAVLPANLDTETMLFVDVTGADVVAKKPPPLDLSIVIDKSGSMAGKRLVNALAAARTAVQRLSDGDVVSVLSFNTAVDVVVDATVVDATSRAKIIAKIATIHAGGDTCISCGIDTAMRVLSQHKGMVDRILLLSDGQPTAGVRDVGSFQRIAENCRRMGVAVTTIGVDLDYDERVMSTIARGSNGHHFFVADPTGLPTIFDQEMASLSKTVANNAELTVDLAPGVSVEQVFDRANLGSTSQIVVPFGTFSAGDHKTLLARVRIPRAGVGERPIAAVRLRYDDLAEAKPGNCDGRLATRLTANTNELTPVDPIVSARESGSVTASTLESANELARNGHRAEAQALVKHARRQLDADRQAGVAAAHTPAAKAAVDQGFQRNEGRLDKADVNFSGDEVQGKRQLKSGESDAFDARQ